MAAPYRGRFAPSQTGPLHAGSLVAALASWLDARAHHGQWLVRMEDVDMARCVAGVDAVILQQLSQCGLHSDAPVVYQSQRRDLYAQALGQLQAKGLAYPCTCTRKAIDAALVAAGVPQVRHEERVYPGTCRPAQALPALAAPARCAWRLRTEQQSAATCKHSIQNEPPALEQRGFHAINSLASAPIVWFDRRLGPQQQQVATQVGDFVLQRADGCTSYQLAVVVDDQAQGITDIVRGQDLLDNTARQWLLQDLLGYAHPAYLHTPLVTDARGEKLSKQHGAPKVDTSTPSAALQALRLAAHNLALPPPPQHARQDEALAIWVRAWSALYAKA